MSTKERLQEDMKAALRAGDKERLSVIRMALAAVKQVEVDRRSAVDEPQTIAVLRKMVKQRRESIGQYRAGKREDLATKEEAEIAVLSEYLPTPLTGAALEALIDEVLEETGAKTLRDMGRVMAAIKARAGARADLSAASSLVRERLES